MLFSCANVSARRARCFFIRKPGNQEFSKKRILGSWVPYGFSVAAAPRWAFLWLWFLLICSISSSALHGHVGIAASGTLAGADMAAPA